jgi:uncharacterized protein YabE (DUF348 family)
VWGRFQVGCCSDATTHQYKGVTVMKEGERYESLRHCKWVDEVLEDGGWAVGTRSFLVWSSREALMDQLPFHVLQPPG